MHNVSSLAALFWHDPASPLNVFSALGLGLALGLKHAVEADHVAAVAVIASERRNILGASLVGGLWGVGHTFALLAAGAAVILLRLPLSARVGAALEMLVALVLVTLGASSLVKLARGGRLHFHVHRHGGLWHAHPHAHAGHDAEPSAETHHGLRLSGARPLLVGALHGFAGSAALMLLVVPIISSRALAMLFLAIFGAGSIGGMMLMSALVALPARLAGRRFGSGTDLFVRGAAGLLSLAFGALTAYRLGFPGGPSN